MTPKVRQLAMPILATLFGIIIGSSWTYLQMQVSALQSGAAAPSVHSASPTRPHAPRETAVVAYPLADLTTAMPPSSAGGSIAQQDIGPLEAIGDWDVGPHLGGDHWFGDTASARSGVLSSVPGTIPIHPLRNRSAATSSYATTGEALVAAMVQRRARTIPTTKKPFRFHVYDIPEKYTTGALQLLEERWATSFCNRHVQKTNYTMLDWRHAFSLFTADVLIAKYLRYHPAHTVDPTEADVFIVPMMTHAYHCAGVNHYTIEILSWLTKFHHYKLFQQHDHFLFWWRWGMHYNSVLRFWKRVMRHTPNINIISFDFLEIMGRNVYQDFSLALKPRFLQTQHSIVMPYPDFSPELSSPQLQIESAVVGVPRKIFFYFAGTRTIGGIRRWIKRNCDAAKDPSTCYYEDFAKNVVDAARLGVPKGYPAAMRNSLFCGHAAGDALSSRRPTSAVLANCIPVLICDLCLYAFENIIDYDSFAVFVSEDDVMAGRLLEVLRAIPQDKIKQMQRNLLAVRKHFVYNTTSAPQPGDALDTLVTQLALRGSVLRQYRRWFTTNHILSADMKDYPVEPAAKKRYLIKGDAAEERDFNALQ